MLVFLNATDMKSKSGYANLAALIVGAELVCIKASQIYSTGRICTDFFDHGPSDIAILEAPYVLSSLFELLLLLTNAELESPNRHHFGPIEQSQIGKLISDLEPQLELSQTVFFDRRQHLILES